MAKTTAADTTTAAPPSRDREGAMTALRDAAERLLVREGHAQLSTRRVAQEAGVNHGLVHYYFGSMEELLMQVLERFTAALIERQRAMYTTDAPFIEKWRAAWRYHEEDLAAGYPKIWLELQAMAWNEPRMRERAIAVNREWREVLTGAFDRARDEYDGELPPTGALVALVMMFGQGAQLERLLGVDDGHRELLAWIDGWLESLEER
jgi:AcrR family transcriptional regulator